MAAPSITDIPSGSAFYVSAHDITAQPYSTTMTIGTGTTTTGAWVFRGPELKVQKLDPEAIVPTKAHHGDLGYDLYALEDVTLVPGEVTLVRTGIACGFPAGNGALLRDRSSVATKKQVFVVAGVIDQGYTGEIKVAFFNPGFPEAIQQFDYSTDASVLKTVVASLNGPERFQKGDKIAQMILMPVMTFPVTEVETLDETSRGDKGFGSSGR